MHLGVAPCCSILLLWLNKMNCWAENWYETWSHSTPKLQQREVNLPLVPYCTNQLDKTFVWVFPPPLISKGKVKCTLVQALRLCTGRTAHRGSRGIALPFHDHGTRRGWGVSVTPRPLFTPGKDPVPIVQEAGWAPGLVWTGAENLSPPGFDPQTVQPIAIRYTDCYLAHTLISRWSMNFLMGTKISYCVVKTAYLHHLLYSCTVSSKFCNAVYWTDCIQLFELNDSIN